MAAQKLRQDGPNSSHGNKQLPWWSMLLRQFGNPIVLILIGATMVSMVAGDAVDGLIILGIVIPSGLLGFFQERRAGKTMETLLKQVSVNVDLIRDGLPISVPIREIVVGDLVVLSAGCIVPADLRIAASSQLLVDESALTGESFPMEKGTDSQSMDLFYGTHVVSGMGRALVVATGANTKFGELVSKLENQDPETRFEKGTKAFGRLLLWSMLTLVGLLLLTNVLLHRSILESLLFSLALAVGITPQLLPVIISVSLAAGARKMAKERVLVKRLDAIEDFGSMNVLCTDKTGTLTHGVANLSGTFSPTGETSQRVLELAYLNATLQSGFENPLDLAIIDAFGKTKTETARLVSELAYDFERRRLSVLVDQGEPNLLLITKGAFNSVMPLCDGGNAQELYETLSEQGNRVLAVASREIPRPADNNLDSIRLELEQECHLTFQGLVAFSDPPKEDAVAAVNEIRSLGIELFLITGDNALAAKHIADQVGLPTEQVMTGSEFKDLTPVELKMTLDAVRVFAEFDPIQKQQLIQKLKDLGNTVGYFGDGINDSAALKIADVGISVDTAVDVAKNAAAIVLLDKSLQVIAQGVRLGRRTFVNTMKYVRVAVSAAFGNVLSMAVADAFLPFLPMLPAQILLLNFLTDFPAVTISSDNVDAEEVAEPRGWSIKEIRWFMVSFGLLSSVFDIAAFLIMSIGFHASAATFRSGWFVESSLTELAVMLTLRTSRAFWKSKPAKGLWISSALIAAVIFMIPYTQLGGLLKLVPVPSAMLLSLLLLTALYLATNELVKTQFFGRGKRRA